MTATAQMKKIKMSALLALILSASSIAVKAQEWNFDVYLDKNKIGKHTFSLNNNVLTSIAKFNVKVLFINAYQYDHKASEQWKNNCLTRLDTKTVENKIETIVKGASLADSFQLSAPKAQSLPTCTMTFAYWNPKILEQAKLLNPQNAEYLDVSVEKLGSESIQVKNKPTQAAHYSLKGALDGKNKLNIELWYNLKNEWVALKSLTPEGYTINYKLN